MPKNICVCPKNLARVSLDNRQRVIQKPWSKLLNHALVKKSAQFFFLQYSQSAKIFPFTKIKLQNFFNFINRIEVKWWKWIICWVIFGAILMVWSQQIGGSWRVYRILIQSLSKRWSRLLLWILINELSAMTFQVV